MRLMLLRHAKAEKAESGWRERPRGLAARGRDDATLIAAHMVRHALLPDRVLISSAQRTRETWACMAPAFSSGLAVDYQDRLYESGTESILSAIKAADPAAAALLVIGHNPGLHDAARLLLAQRGGGASALDAGLPTCGLVVIDLADGGWRKLAARSGHLAAFVTPRLIKSGED
jgi:phosphohistidine phosphatase